MNNPKNLIIHHTAVSRTKNAHQFEATDNYHKSKGWGQIGYHYLIEPDGTVMQGRKENETGAHTSQLNMNFFSLGICLTGDFDTEEPTKEQCESLLLLIQKKQREYAIPENHVVPHRKYAPKSCWGKLLPDDILGYCKRRLASDMPDISAWAMASVQKAKDQGKITNWESPKSPMKPADLRWAFHKCGVKIELCDRELTREEWAVVFDRLGLLNPV